MPPAMTRSSMPDMMVGAARLAVVMPEPGVKGRMGNKKDTKDPPAVTKSLIINVKSGSQTKALGLLRGRSSTTRPIKVDINGPEVYSTYGRKTIELPFSITLNDFIAEKYPGTEKSYKSFKSKVTVNNADGTFQEEEIFMNNVLDKEGFRFFQSGFQPDEKGTILAVNHDMWGTWITYIGYFLLYFGLMAILFDGNSRFGNLKKYLEKIKKKKKDKEKDVRRGRREKEKGKKRKRERKEDKEKRKEEER